MIALVKSGPEAGATAGAMAGESFSLRLVRGGEELCDEAGSDCEYPLSCLRGSCGGGRLLGGKVRVSGVDTGGGASGRGAVEVYVISACIGCEVKGCAYCWDAQDSCCHCWAWAEEMLYGADG